MKKISIYDMAKCGIMTALMCVLSPVAVPIGPIPVTLSTLMVCLTTVILGTKLGILSYLIYLLLGAVGLPVFSGYAGGVGKLIGPTGGYLIGFIFMVIIGGIFVSKFKAKIWLTGVGMLFGLIVTYAFGTVWFVISMKVDVSYALSVCVWPFIPFDIAKIIVAILLGTAVNRALKKAIK